MKMMREQISEQEDMAAVANQASALAEILKERNEILEAELKNTRQQLAQAIHFRRFCLAFENAITAERETREVYSLHAITLLSLSPSFCRL